MAAKKKETPKPAAKKAAAKKPAGKPAAASPPPPSTPPPRVRGQMEGVGLPRALAPWEEGQPQLPPNEDPACLAALWEWQQLKAQIARECAPLWEKEKELRRKMAKLFFPAEPEGTSKLALPKGWELKVTLPYERKFDEAQMTAVFQQLPEGSWERLIRWEPHLNVENFRTLPEDQKKILQDCIIEKPGMPTIYVNPPREADK